MKQFIASVAVAASALFALPVAAGGLVLDTAESSIHFSSIKARHIAETHSFSQFSGVITEEGAVVEVALTSLSTGIPIRDERMRKELLDDDAIKATAKVGVIDVLEHPLNGKSREHNVKIEFSAFGKSFTKKATVRVLDQGDNGLRVYSVSPVMLSTEQMGIAANVDKLRRIAGLSDISQAVPLSFDLVFRRSK